MVRRALKGLLAITLMATGLLVVTETPAFAQADNCNKSNPWVHVCIDFGTKPNLLQSWFNLVKAPDSSVHHYGVVRDLDGQTVQVASGVFTTVKNYGPWTKPVQTLPPSSHKARTIVYVYTSSGALHFILTSSYITFVN